MWILQQGMLSHTINCLHKTILNAKWEAKTLFDYEYCKTTMWHSKFRGNICNPLVLSQGEDTWISCSHLIKQYINQDIHKMRVRRQWDSYQTSPDSSLLIDRLPQRHQMSFVSTKPAMQLITVLFYLPKKNLVCGTNVLFSQRREWHHTHCSTSLECLIISRFVRFADTYIQEHFHPSPQRILCSVIPIDC